MLRQRIGILLAVKDAHHPRLGSQGRTVHDAALLFLLHSACKLLRWSRPRVAPL